ncbi:MAG: phospholipase D-like domain-containing protein, partial [Bacteroidota bacterium]
MRKSFIRKRKKIYHCANTELIRGGEPFFTRLLQLIKNAKNCIHIQVYIFGDDETGHTIAEALIEACRRGVQVYLLVDGYASSLPKEFIQQLTNAGIHFRFFEPVFRSRHFYFGRRLHHKVIVIDESIALVGGLNLADRYNDTDQEKAWMDMALQVDGGAAMELQQVCNELWKKKIYIPFTRKKTGQQITEASAKENDCLV